MYVMRGRRLLSRRQIDGVHEAGSQRQAVPYVLGYGPRTAGLSTGEMAAGGGFRHRWKTIVVIVRTR